MENILWIYIFSVISIILYSYAYYVTARVYGTKKDKENFKTYENALYYTTIMHFTVGLGDIAPESVLMKRITITQVLVSFFLLQGGWKSTNK